MNKKQFLVYSLLSDLKIQWIRSEDNSIQISSLTISDYPWLIKQRNVKPILRPLSDLTNEINYNGEKFIPIEVIKSIRSIVNPSIYFISDFKTSIKSGLISFDLIQMLITWHFDICGLIESGEAIDVNTLDINPYNI